MKRLKKSKHNESYVSLSVLTSAAYAILAAICALAYFLPTEFQNKPTIITGCGLIALLGLFYNFVVFRAIKKRSEFFSKYLQMFFVIAALGLTAFFGGGVNSSWYLALLFVIIICSVLGYRAIYLNLFWLVTFFSADIVFNLLRNPDSSFQFRVFPITLAALVCAWLVAYSTESLKSAKASVQKFGAQLDRNRLSERSLLAAAGTLHPNMAITTMAISYENLNKEGGSDHPISPCGMCRQALQEYEDRTGLPIRLILSGQKGSIYIIEKAGHLLPLAFSGNEFKNK